MTQEKIAELPKTISREEAFEVTMEEAFEVTIKLFKEHKEQSDKKIAELEAENKKLREKLRESFSSIAAENNLGLSELEYMPREELISLIKNRFRFLPMEVK